MDEWNDNKEYFLDYEQLAYKNIEKYFLNILSKSNQKQERDYAWHKLLQIYAKKSPQKIINLLPEINSGLIEQISPANAWIYLSVLIDKTKYDIISFKTLYYKILKMCFEMELYNEGYYCVTLMEQTIPLNLDFKLLLYKSMYLSALDKHDKNIELYQTYMPIVENNSQIYFHLNMIVLCSYRSLNYYNKCLEIHHMLLRNRKLMDPYNYAIFLRLVNIYLPDNEALWYAYKSIRCFRKLNNSVQEAKSMITYAKLLSGLGKNKKAIKIIKKAENLLTKIYVGKHMIYSNLAAFMLTQGNKTDEVWLLLSQAECSAVVPYDKLGIIVNKLVWCYENKRYDMLELFICQVNELIPQEPDEHVHVLIYYNLYLIYNQLGDSKYSKKYYDLAYKNRKKCKFIQARFEGSKSKEMRFRLQHPWHICYLSYWTYDLDI